MKRTGPARSLLEQSVRDSIRRPNTIRNYLGAVDSFVAFAGAAPERWTGAVLVRWREHLQEVVVERPGRRARRLSARSINAKLAAVRFASKRAVALGYITYDFARAAEFLPVVYEQTRAPLALAAARAMLAACAGTGAREIRDRALLELGFYHGCRRESLAGLRLADVDLVTERMTFIIKGGRRHTAPLDPQCQDALRAWMSWLASRGVETGNVFRGLRAALDKKGGWVVTTRLTAGAVYKVIRARAAAAGIAKFHPHLMRHCFISWAVANGHSIEEIMLVTGHRNPASVLGYMGEVRLGARPQSMIPDLKED